MRCFRSRRATAEGEEAVGGQFFFLVYISSQPLLVLLLPARLHPLPPDTHTLRHCKADPQVPACAVARRCVDLPVVGRQCQGGGESNPLYDACAGLAQVRLHCFARILCPTDRLACEASASHAAPAEYDAV